MKMLILKITVALIFVISILFALVSPGLQTKKSIEGQLISEICEDIQAYETLRAESEIEMAIEVIKNHVYENNKSSDTLVNGMIEKLKILEDEVMFHNTDKDFYNIEFANVLYRLSFLELNEAFNYIQNDQNQSAKKSLAKAQHYLHDGLKISKIYDKTGFDLFRKLTVINKDKLNAKDIDDLIKEIKKVIEFQRVS